MGTYVRPTSLVHALECRAAGAEILAGGTDFWPVRVGKPTYSSPNATILDLSALHDLRAIDTADTTLRIGALATWTSLAEADLPPAFHALQMAAREVGGRQIQNRGTIGGNLCNASPAADGVPPLLILDASVELSSVGGTRTAPLSEFLTAPRRTMLRADEVLTAILVPMPNADARSHFIKLGARKYQLISIVMGAALLSIEEERVAKAAIAIGSCSPVACRLTALERDLIGARVGELASVVTSQHVSALTPIDDIRADAAYRHDAAQVVVRRLLSTLAGDA
jgi:CO/xanthine dehydrogenase FAD-binding subunit